MNIEKILKEFDQLYSCKFRWRNERPSQPDAVDYLKDKFKTLKQNHKEDIQEILEKVLPKEGDYPDNKYDCTQEFINAEVLREQGFDHCVYQINKAVDKYLKE